MFFNLNFEKFGSTGHIKCIITIFHLNIFPKGYCSSIIQSSNKQTKGSIQMYDNFIFEDTFWVGVENLSNCLVTIIKGWQLYTIVQILPFPVKWYDETSLR